MKDGVLNAQFGVTGQPSSVTLTGKIAADGTASIDARGTTGDPKNTLNRLAKGSPYV